MKSALNKSAANATYVEFDDGDHYLSIQEDRQRFLVEIEKFLNTSNDKSEFIK